MDHQDDMKLKMIFEGGPAEGAEYEYYAPKDDQIKGVPEVVYAWHMPRDESIDDLDSPNVCKSLSPSQFYETHIYEIEFKIHPEDDNMLYPFFDYKGKYRVPRKETA